MCIAILNRKNLISEDILESCYYNNPDGCGLSFVDDNNKIQIKKELNNFDKFYHIYETNRLKYPESNFLIHFRIATSGRIDLKNCHPFKPYENMSFIHNGVINRGTKNESDTVLFSKLLTRLRNKDFLNNSSIIELIREYIGASKLVFLTSDNNYKIINESAGIWYEGNWYSNTHFKRYHNSTCFVCGSEFHSDNIYSSNSFEVCKDCKNSFTKSDLKYFFDEEYLSINDNPVNNTKRKGAK